MFKDLIKKLRKENNMTQSELGEILEYSQDTISKWETDESVKPDFETIRKLCVLFNISADELLEIDTEKQKAEVLSKIKNNL